MEDLPARSETAADIDAVGSLLSVIEREAAHPQTVICDKAWFEEDGSFDATIGPLLAEIGDINNDNAYQVGLRPDGLGQVIMLQRERGGVVGRVVISLSRGTRSKVYGERREPWGANGLTYRKILDGEPIDPNVLVGLSELLPVAFEEKRRRIAQEQRSRTVLGKVSTWLETHLGGSLSRSSDGAIGRHRAVGRTPGRS